MNFLEELRPVAYINGVRLNDRAALGRLAAIAKFTIAWGAKDWYSQVEPAVLTIDVLDEAGQFLDLAGGAGIPIRIRRGDVFKGPDSITVFDGTIDSTVSELVSINNPATGAPREVWRVTIQASDPLGTLEQDRRHGPKWPERELESKRLHWGPCRMIERREALSARSPVGIEWQASNLDQYDEAPVLLMHPVAAYETQQNISVLTVLRQTARISQIMNRPYYEPLTQKIRFIAPPPASGLRISQGVTGALFSTPISGTELLPASEFEAGSDDTISSAAIEQVTRVELTRRAEQRNLDQSPTFYSMEEVSEEVNAVTSTAGTTSWAIATDHAASFNYFADWADLARSHIAGTYGRQTPAPLEWRPKYGYFALTHVAAFLNPSPPLGVDGVPIAYQLLGARSSWAPGIGPFSIVGGEISYSEKGWKSVMFPATTRRLSTVPTLGAFASSAPIGSFEAGPILADLTKLTAAN